MPSQQIGLAKHLQNDLFCDEWAHLNQSVSYHFTASTTCTSRQAQLRTEGSPDGVMVVTLDSQKLFGFIS